MNLKKISFSIVLGLLVLGVVVTANASQGPTGRYLISSTDGLLKAITGVRWAFDNGYTTDLTDGQLAAISILTSRLGISVEPVALYEITAKPQPASRTKFPSDQTPWGIEKIYNNATITSTSGGLGVDVAVLDTGVLKSHFDLKQRLAQCKDFSSNRSPMIDGKCDDGNGHGTHVAGTVLADAGADGKGIYGVAPEAKLFAYKVCGTSGFCWADDISMAIRTAADQGAEIVSMSLGADSESDLIRDAIVYATSHGSLVVAAAGNDGPALGSIDYPGANVNVVAVAAIDINEAVPDWSSRGVNNGDYVIQEREVEFGAPGVAVESTWKDGGYNTISGTSMATPHMSGLAAKLWQGSASLTRTHLQNLAKLHDLAAPGDDPATGFGLPQVQ